MFKRTLQPSDLFLIGVNLIPVYGVWFEDWSAKEVFIVYALETLIAGAFTVLKLGITTLYKKQDLWYNNNTTTKVSGLFFILFFILHYGLFACVQTSIFAASANINPPNSGLLHFFFHWYEYVNVDIAIMLAAFSISYLVKDLIPFIIRGEYRTASMMRLMFQPYARIFFQQFIVILGSLFLNFGWDKIFVLVFAGVKIFFEIFLNLDNYMKKAMVDMEKSTDIKP